MQSTERLGSCASCTSGRYGAGDGSGVAFTEHCVECLAGQFLGTAAASGTSNNNPCTEPARPRKVSASSSLGRVWEKIARREGAL